LANYLLRWFIAILGLKSNVFQFFDFYEEINILYIFIFVLYV
jgi:hypothetical protein